jgi:hypothetical protein
MPSVTQISLGSATIQTEHEPPGDWEHVMLSLLDHLHETTFFWDLEFRSTTLNFHVKRKEINEKRETKLRKRGHEMTAKINPQAVLFSFTFWWPLIFTITTMSLENFSQLARLVRITCTCVLSFFVYSSRCGITYQYLSYPSNTAFFCIIGFITLLH